ncbi:MAG: hypothetical protein JSW60_02575 [Thermoplasmatales archaeon]|nr:MAG: hypothetical protein JSW60_02575 [Thermoplasmatales archaeon]
MNKKNYILKEAGVLLVAAVMILSTVAVTAETENDIKIRDRQTCIADSFEEVGYTSIESDPSAYLHNAGGPVIFSQQPVPDDTGAHGPFSDAGQGFRVYENFWGLTEDIRDVHWWGLWGFGSGTPTAGDAFEISFCADNGTVPDYNNHIVDFTGSLGTEITYVGTGNFYFGYELYYMEMDLPAPVSMASGWVSFYKTTINAQRFAMIDALTGDSNAYQLNAIIPFLDYDVAFELTGGIAELEIANVAGGFAVSADVKNVGAITAENVLWEIKFDGGFIFLPPGGIASGGPFDISTASDLTISTMAFGFGGIILPLNIIISATADNADPVNTTVPAKLLLIFVDI